MAVTVDYTLLKNVPESEDVQLCIQEAFGSQQTALGLLLVTGLPSEYTKLRTDLLSQGRPLAALPDEELQKLECEEAMWLVGWSLGKEKLGHSKLPDYRKGSFYANPIKDGSGKGAYPQYDHKNLYPSEGSLSSFKENFEGLGKFIAMEVGLVVAKACDIYAAKNLINYSRNYLVDMIKDSSSTKARLLHYFASEDVKGNDEEHNSEDDWCGEHLDHGSLTGLTSAMYCDKTSDEEIDSPDADSGLYVRDRLDQLVKVRIPRKAIAFQIGQALQVATNGQFIATPHYVRGCRSKPTIYRNAYAVFMQPRMEDELGVSGLTFANYANEIVQANH